MSPRTVAKSTAGVGVASRGFIGVCGRPKDAGGIGIVVVVGFCRNKAGLSSAARTRDLRCVVGGGSDMVVVSSEGSRRAARRDRGHVLSRRPKPSNKAAKF